MQRRLSRLRILPALWPALLLLCSCQQEQALQGSEAVDTGPVRPAVDALDKTTADARKARISNLEYDALIDIASSEEEISGEVTIQFDLSDASSPLTLDFTGGTLNEVQINRETITADYNDYYITLPAEQLQLGPNTVQITYRHPYGHDGTGLHRFVDPEDGWLSCRRTGPGRMAEPETIHAAIEKLLRAENDK